MATTADRPGLAAGQATGQVSGQPVNGQPVPALGWLARRGLLTDLEHPGQIFANITPNWFASVMGTGIVAVAAASLPEQFAGLRAAATAVWGLAAVMLVALTAATAVHWLRYRATARSHVSDPVMSHFYGAPPMAILTVGAGMLLLGRDVVGLAAAVDVDWVLWLTGATLGLITAIAAPYLQLTRRRLKLNAAFGGWLMPVVPPMVSASTGALLVPYAPAGAARLTLLLACYAMFGFGLLAAAIVTPLIWRKLARHGIGPARLVPTLWIILGPLGQSVTAASLLGRVAGDALPARTAVGLRDFGVAYGFPVWGLALAWAAVATVITLRTARRHLPFSLTWWSFTFPVGTCVTGTTELAVATGSAALRVLAAAGYAALVVAWLIVATRTARASARGWLLLPAPPQAEA